MQKLTAPAGYRYPVEGDVGDYWDFYKGEHSQQASCDSADLNGDGIADYVSFAFSTGGSGFAIVVLYSSGGNRYNPRVVWEDPGEFYHAVNGTVGIIQGGRHEKYFGCVAGNEVNVTLPVAGVDYFTRERQGKPEHRLFWSSDNGATISQRSLCP